MNDILNPINSKLYGKEPLYNQKLPDSQIDYSQFNKCNVCSDSDKYFESWQ